MITTRFHAFTVSLVLHLAGLGLLILWSDMASKTPLHHQLVELFPARHDQQEQLIRVLIKDDEKHSSKHNEVNFKAAQKMRVKEQTQARFLGPTVNRLFPSLIPKNLMPNPDKRDSAKDEGGTLPVHIAKPRQKIPLGISTISAQLPDNVAKLGDFTSLNTDQDLYFSFFNRIVPQIRFYWYEAVEKELDSMAFQKLNIREKKTFVTEVDVQIDKNGHLVRTLIFRSSGVPGLDAAVEKAIAQSSPYINPPREMVKEDGLIHLLWAFNVHYTPYFYAHPNGSASDF